LIADQPIKNFDITWKRVSECRHLWQILNSEPSAIQSEIGRYTPNIIFHEENTIVESTTQQTELPIRCQKEHMTPKNNRSFKGNNHSFILPKEVRCCLKTRILGVIWNTKE